MIGVDDFDSLVNDAIKQLASDNINDGVDCLVSLAHVFAKAGCRIESFLDMRKYIIKEAIKMTDAYFIETKIKLAERQLREMRNGNRRIIVH